MLERGAFDGVHAAMMVHPWPDDRLEATCLAVSHFDVTLHRAGRPTPRPRPWEGINALRRHDRRPGGHRPPAPAAAPRRPGARRRHRRRPGGQHHPGRRSAGRFMCRSRTARRPGRARAQGAGVLRGRGPGHRVRRLLRGALPPPTRTWSPTRACWPPTGPTPRPWDGGSPSTTRGEPPPTLSTDMANVSLAVPIIHPLMAIEAGGAVNHQPVRRRLRHPLGRRRRARRGPGHGLDGHRRRHLRGAAQPPCGPGVVSPTEGGPGPDGHGVLEHAVLDVAPGREAAFELAFAEARQYIASAPGFRWLRLDRCLERPSRYLLLVGWETLEDHTGGLPGIARLPRVAPAPPPLLRAVPHRRALHRGGAGLTAGAPAVTPVVDAELAAQHVGHLAQGGHPAPGPTFMGTSRFCVPRAAASHVGQRGVDRRLVALGAHPADPGHLGPLELDVDREDLGRLRRPRRRTG